MKTGDYVVPLERQPGWDKLPPKYIDYMTKLAGKKSRVTIVFNKLNMIQLDDRFFYRMDWVRRLDE